MRLRAATAEDAEALAAIYRPYVTQSAVSFETATPTTGEMRERILAGAGFHPWLVAEVDATGPCGYAYSSQFRPRPAYRYAVETSVYVDVAVQGQGVGGALYAALIETLEAQGYVQAIAAITLPNPASVRLHERLGFAPAGIYRRVGYKLDAWHDVGLWQRGLAPEATPPVEPRALGELSLQRR